METWIIQILTGIISIAPRRGFLLDADISGMGMVKLGLLCASFFYDSLSFDAIGLYSILEFQNECSNDSNCPDG